MLTPLTSRNISDLRLCGNVSYTGQSSMEVVVKMELVGVSDETVMLGGLRWNAQRPLFRDILIFPGRFSMVCRDAFTQKAKSIPSLTLSTPEEQTLFAMGAGM